MRACPYRKIFATLILLTASAAHADNGNGVSAGLILSQDPSARAASLGGAIEASADDISAFGYNPAAISSLKNDAAVVGFQRGLVDDSFSQIQYGHALGNGGLGASLSLYQGGKMDFIEGGVKQKTVISEQDTAAAVGYSHLFQGVSLGVAAKYLSSNLAETEKASTVALDFGAATDVTSRIRIAGAYQNLGAKLKYGSEQSSIPQTARIGAAFQAPTKSPVTLLVDFPYLINEARIDAALGAEAQFGVIALRAGYRTGISLGGLSLGAGVALNKFSFDYAFGLVQDLQSSHRVSLTFRFGAAPDVTTVRAPEYYKPEPQRLPATASKRKAFPSSIEASDSKSDKPKDPVALKPAPIIIKPSEPVPVFNGVGRSVDCADPNSGAGMVNYGGGRADCNK